MNQSPVFRSLLAGSVLALTLLLPGCGIEGGEGAHEVPSAPRRVGDLQGSGERSPFVGQRLRIQGVVTGNFVGGLGGFFMQDAVGEDDGDPSTSDGVFVQWPRGAEPKVRRGDRVRVNGVVAEEGPDGASMTMLVDSEVSVLGRAAVAAVSLSQAPASAADYERFEGMWVRVEGPLVVSGNGGLLRFGELVVNFGERLRQPTDVYPPGFDARALEADQQRRMLVLDDGRSSEYPERIGYLPEPLSQSAPLRAGSRIAAAEGVLEQRFGRWTLQVRRDLSIADQAARPQLPTLQPGLRVLSFNLENFFNGNGRGGGFPTPRGAASREDFDRQRDKLVSVLRATAPDIAALMEVENDGYGKRSALAQLVDALNSARADAGEAADYAFVETAEAPGGDQIKVALIYRKSQVQPVGEAAVASGEAFVRGSRPPLLQTFAASAGGAPFSVVVNHWKSKGGCDSAQGGDREQGDGQGCWNAARVAAARDLLSWLEQRGGDLDGGRRLLMGDFNAYRQEDPIRLLREAGYRDVLELAGRGDHYSYNWRGLAGSLDHGFASPALAAEVRDAAVWGINADEAEAFKYASFARNPDGYTAGPWASSDHDPLLLVLRAPEAAANPAR